MEYNAKACTWTPGYRIQVKATLQQDYSDLNIHIRFAYLLALLESSELQKELLYPSYALSYQSDFFSFFVSVIGIDSSNSINYLIELNCYRAKQ